MIENNKNFRQNRLGILSKSALDLLNKRLLAIYEEEACQEEDFYTPHTHKRRAFSNDYKREKMGVDIGSAKKMLNGEGVQENLCMAVFQCLKLTWDKKYWVRLPPKTHNLDESAQQHTGNIIPDPNTSSVGLQEEARPIKDNIPGNLPAPPTALVGRKKEIEDVCRMLNGGRRLATLVGPGGIGKTRLAIEAAFRIAKRFLDGICFVDLAPLRDPTPAFIEAEVAKALGVGEEAGESLRETLKKTLAHRSLLLILNNCEYLRETWSVLIFDLLQAAPNLQVLVTSQKALELAGEKLYEVPPLCLPLTEGQEMDAEALMHYDAIKLFVERAQDVKSDFQLNSSNASEVLSLCRHLNGSPLDIEVAAARIRSFSPSKIEAKFRQSLDWPPNRNPVVPARQQNRRARYDWAYKWLEPEEQALLRYLSVFAGGWTMAAAEWLCSGELLAMTDVTDLLASLFEYNLVTQEGEGENKRFHMQETIRKYADEKLQTYGETKQIRDRHLDWCLMLDTLALQQSGEWSLFDTEYNNLRAALAWAMESATEKGLLLCGMLRPYWGTRGLYSEGLEWCLKALDRADAYNYKIERTKVLDGAGGMAYYQADYATALKYWEQILPIRQELQDWKGIAALQSNLGLIYLHQGELAKAKFAFEDSRRLRQKMGNEEGVADALYHIGLVEYAQGNYGAARKFFEQSLSAFQQFARHKKDAHQEGIANAQYGLGLVSLSLNNAADATSYLKSSLSLFKAIEYPVGKAEVLLGLGLLALTQGDPATARAHFTQSLTIQVHVNNRLGIADVLEAFVSLAVARNQLERAGQLAGFAEALRLKIDAPLLPYKKEEYEKKVKFVQEAMDETEFQAAQAIGQAMTQEQICEFAMNGNSA